METNDFVKPIKNWAMVTVSAGIFCGGATASVALVVKACLEIWNFIMGWSL
jgi:hypothetical protein